MTAPWLALHVFYAGDQDRFLLEAIHPALNRLVAEHAIKRYFFIRYWNGGPHLRIRVERTVCDNWVENALRADLERYLHEYPGGAPDPVRYETEASRIRQVEEQLGAAAVGAAERLEPLQPADSIQTRQYQFDEPRYGGGDAINITHEHAWASSRIALAVLEVTRGDSALKQAFALHAAAICASLLEAEAPQPAMLFEEASRWDVAAEGAGNEERWRRFGFLTYEVQRSALENVRLLMTNRPVAWPDYWRLLLDAWRRELARHRECLLRRRGEHTTGTPPDFLLLDALHLLCNRLGLGLTSECYVYYLVAELLKEGAEVLPGSLGERAC